jgi:hypothetical protein
MSWLSSSWMLLPSAPKWGLSSALRTAPGACSNQADFHVFVGLGPHIADNEAKFQELIRR